MKKLYILVLSFLFMWSLPSSSFALMLSDKEVVREYVERIQSSISPISGVSVETQKGVVWGVLSRIFDSSWLLKSDYIYAFRSIMWDSSGYVPRWVGDTFLPGSIKDSGTLITLTSPIHSNSYVKAEEFIRNDGSTIDSIPRPPVCMGTGSTLWWDGANWICHKTSNYWNVTQIQSSSKSPYKLKYSKVVKRDYSATMNHTWGFPSWNTYPNEKAFAALKDDGSIFSWGDPWSGWDNAPTGTWFTNIFSTWNAFSALRGDGTIKSWGAPFTGWWSAPTDSWYIDIFSTQRAFAALKANGDFSTWGMWVAGQYLSMSHWWVKDIITTGKDFAALTEDGRILAWGMGFWEGMYVLPITWVEKVFSNWYEFAALKNGRIYGIHPMKMIYEISPSSGGWFIDVTSRLGWFAARKLDWSILIWGQDNLFRTMDSEKVQIIKKSGYTKIYSNNLMFAAKNIDGSFDTWWSNPLASETSFLKTRTLSASNISSNERAFSSIIEGGKISSWGPAHNWGTTQISWWGYTKIYSSPSWFSALHSDGTITSWGTYKNNSDYVSFDGLSLEGSEFKDISSNSYAFAALKDDWSIFSWGHSDYGGSWAPTGTGFIVINGWVY